MRTEARKEIKEFEIMVANVIRETPDVSTLVLFTGNDTLEYQPGHAISIDPHQFRSLGRFISYLEDLKGRKESPRLYSLFSAPSESHLAITIKEEYYVSQSTKYPPLLSPLLVHRIKTGDKMVVKGFTGPYTLPMDIEDRTDHMVHLCAGSGVVPNMSMIKEALARGLKVRHTLIFSNKTQEDIIYKPLLEQLQEKYPKQFRVIHALTREPQGAQLGFEYHPGRVNRALIEKEIPDFGTAAFFLCGPSITKWDRQKAKETGEESKPRFLESALERLNDLGVKKEQIHKESYG